MSTTPKRAYRVIVEYDRDAPLGGHCVVLTVFGGNDAQRFLIPFNQVDAVAEAMIDARLDVVDTFRHPFTCAKCGVVGECEDEPCEDGSSKHHCWPCHPDTPPRPDSGPTS